MLLLSACAIGAFGQADTATITGIISDPSGGAIPGAAVAVTNRATGLKYRDVTNAAGVYSVTALPIGVYDLSVTRAGFQTVERSEVALHAGDRARIDLQLQVGAVNQVVQVTTQAPLLESETSNLSQVVDNTKIVNMPLNGRDYQQLALLAPGVVYSRTQNFVTDAFSANGANMLQNQFLMDGMDNTNYLYGVVTASNEIVKPSIDAIQEFRTETQAFSAEFGGGAGAKVVVTTKSGTNQFHGTAFEFLRNDKIEANDFFNSGNTKPPFRQNQFGGTFGGPIKKNKTFFFASYQGTRIREKLTFLSVVPTPQFIAGDFGSTPVYDPATESATGARQPFPGNRIPSDRIDPVAVRMLQLYPAPNRAGVQNYLFNPSRNTNDSQVDSRLDHRFRESDSIFLRYSFHDYYRLEPGNLPVPASGGNTAVRLARAHTAVLNYTHLFGSNIVNEIRLAYSRNGGRIDVPTTTQLWQQFGFLGLFQRSDINGLPLFNLSGLTSVGDRSYAVDPKDVDIHQLGDGLSWLKGRHSMKMGTDILSVIRYAGTTNFARGVFAFNGQFTSAQAGAGAGSPFADALLGLTQDAYVSNALDASLRSRVWGLYLQDNFKVSHKLTLNLGMRWEYQPPFVERNNRLANFVTDPGLPGFGTIVRVQGDGVEQRSFVRRDLRDFAPRVGLAYQVTPSTVIRAGYGIFYDTNVQTPFSDLPVSNPPFYVQSDFPTANQSAVSSLTVRSGFPPSALQSSSLAGLALFSAWPYAMPIGITNQWNINIQRTLPGNTVLSAAYIGSHSAHRHLTAQDINQPYPGPGTLNARRAFPAEAAITRSVPFGTANYQALELKVERRFAGGFSTLNGYTWGHSLQTDIGQDTRDLLREKAASPQDMRQRLFSTVVWALPFGSGRKWLHSGAISQVVRDWQVSTLFVAQSGLYVTPIISTNTANTTGTLRPNRLREGNLPTGQRSPSHWFDTSAFIAPPAYQFGNSGLDIIEAPSLVNLDSTIARQFKLSDRFRIDFRAEFFNFLNTPHFDLPNTTVDKPVGGTIGDSIAPARQLQFGLKLQF
jgi:hypothetical protein